MMHERDTFLTNRKTDLLLQTSYPVSHIYVYHLLSPPSPHSKTSYKGLFKSTGRFKLFAILVISQPSIETTAHNIIHSMGKNKTPQTFLTSIFGTQIPIELNF